MSLDGLATSRAWHARAFSYRDPVIGFLRFVGILNAAVWFGAAVFFTFGAGLAPFSPEMKTLLGPNNYPYFSGAIAQIFIARYFHLQSSAASSPFCICWRNGFTSASSRRSCRPGCWSGCASAALVGGYWLQPKLKALHATKYGLNTRPEVREAADRSFRAWHGVSQVVNLLLVGGLAAYLWRAANPSDPTRFVSAVKFTMR